jgi:hypothetical protein
MNNTTTAIAAVIFIAATLVVAVGTFAATIATQSTAFAYPQKNKGGHEENSRNGNTITIQKCKQAATQSGFDNDQGQECENLICTHPDDNATCSQEGVTSTLQTANLVVCKVLKDFNTGRILDPASAFTLQVTGNNPSPSSFPGSAPPTCTTITLGPGGFQVREVGTTSSGDAAFCNGFGIGKDVIIDRAHLHNEYCVNFSQGCSGTIAAGETKTCTVTNSAADIG